MRVKEPFKRSGYFHLSTCPQRQLPGTLSISDGGCAELEVVGLFEKTNSPDSLHIERIVGNIEKDGPVTLEDCLYRNKEITIGGISKCLLDVGRVILGAAYGPGEEVLLNTLKFSVEGIDEWVDISGVKVDHDFEQRISTITYQRPAEIDYTLQNGMKLLISFVSTVPGFPNMREASVTQKTYFMLISDEKRSLQDFISTAHKMASFLCFAIGQTVGLENLTAASEDVLRELADGRLIPQPMKIYYQSLPFSKHEPKIDHYRMLFRFGQISHNALNHN